MCTLTSTFLVAICATTAAVPASPTDLAVGHPILTNYEAGTVIHPFIPHGTLLRRRRRELRDNHAAEHDVALPPRPTTSRHSSRRRGQQQMGALYQGYGTHYVDLWVGSPVPQRQTVIVDTGSGVTAFPCEGCKKCGDTYHTDGRYHESQSETFKALGCSECLRGRCGWNAGGKKCLISMRYAEGSSWSAFEGRDLCYAGGPHDAALQVTGPMTNLEDIDLDHIDPVEATHFAFELAFGCQTSITGLFIKQLADGIMGMQDEKAAFWKQMHTKGAIPRPEFSLCFSRSNQAGRDGTGAGAMTLGGVDPRLHASPMAYARNTKRSGSYAVRLRAVYLREGGGASARTTKEDMKRMHRLNLSESQLNAGNVIVDSGTTDTYFTRQLAGPFNRLWKEITGKEYGHRPMSLTAEEIDKMPAIILVFAGHDGPEGADPDKVANYVGDVPGLSENPRDVVLAVPAAHYLERDDDGRYVPRIYTDERSGSVLGANAMMGHDVHFDVAGGRIGFAESDCDYASLLLSEGGAGGVPPSEPAGAGAEAVPVGEEEEEDLAGPGEVAVPFGEKEEEDPAVAEEVEALELSAEEGRVGIETGNPVEPMEMPGRDRSDNGAPHESFRSSKPAQILDDLKHECSSPECRGVVGVLILGTAAMVIAAVRGALAWRRVVRQYQEADAIEFSDLAMDSDSDEDEGRHVDEPPTPRIT